MITIEGLTILALLAAWLIGGDLRRMYLTGTLPKRKTGGPT